jgi:haloalkane dehalogenase
MKGKKMTITRRNLFLTTSLALAGATVLGPEPVLAQAEDTSSPYGLPISSEFPFTKQTADVLGSTMTYVDEGTGPVVLFLHGNPTSSYLWRNIIPHVVADGFRAIAPDLIGMGDSGKPDIGYTFGEHAAYLDALIDTLDLRDITLVIHDWGSGLGMRYARLNPDNVRAMAFMEAVVPPGMPAPSYEALGPENGPVFQALRTEGVGEEMVLTNNMFVEQLLPGLVARPLTEAEMAHYRAPYSTPESRLPTLQWPREVPIGGEPQETVDAITANGQWLTTSEIPKLLFYGTPGAIIPEPAVQWLITNVSNMETRFVGPGTHFIQEDHPEIIGRGIADWLRRIAA